MLPFIGDIDIMFYDNDELVVSSVDRVHRYTELPPEFHTRDEIQVYEMVDSQFPGYVFTRFVGKLVKCGQENSYEFEPAVNRYAIATRLNSFTHGPSQRLFGAVRKVDLEGVPLKNMSADDVQSPRCWNGQL
jgi:hypothetical protein